MCWATAISLASASRFPPYSGASTARRPSGSPVNDLRQRSARDETRWMPSSRQRTAGSLKPPPRGFVGWKSKPIAPWQRGKASDQDPGTGEMVEQVDSIAPFKQTKKIGAAKQFQARAAGGAVEPSS